MRPDYNEPLGSLDNFLSGYLLAAKLTFNTFLVWETDNN